VANDRTFGGSGLKVVGLKESIAALRRVDPLLAKEGTQIIRTETKKIQARAQASIGNHPQYRMGRQKGMIGFSATGAGAAIKLNASKYPWALAGEFGDNVWHVYGKARKESGLRRRVAAPNKPPTDGDMWKNTGGYWIQPAIRKSLPHFQKELNDGLTELFTRALRQAGVPGGR
jgi:hypothetical protein